MDNLKSPKGEHHVVFYIVEGAREKQGSAK
jgi:hypothetical protein